MKNCIIIHGSPEKEEQDPSKRTYDKHWIPWLKKELEKNEIKCDTPLMPEPWEPQYSEWKEEFEKLDINDDSILVGHSSGGGFLVRWLGDTGMKIKKLILVAPAIIHSGEWKVLEDLLKFDINSSVKNIVKKIIIFVSSDDDKGILRSVEIFSKKLNVKPIIMTNKGHFTLGEMGTEEFPELLNKILN